MPATKPDNTIRDNVTELIRRVSTQLPEDVLAALRRGRGRESAGGFARAIFDTIIDNAAIARRDDAPLCQDTGTLTFYGRLPSGWNQNRIEQAIRQAVRSATRRGYLRSNTVDPVSNLSAAGNISAGAPGFIWTPSRGGSLELRLLMKGGGCENMSAQYSLPDARLAAGRDLEGVRRCILDTVTNAQGYGCAPGVLGVCVGGDRAGGFEDAKRLFLLPLGVAAANPELAALERRVLREANTLNIGPMGMGGRVTLLDVKITARSRLPASFFVTAAYMCWALRRGGFRMNSSFSIERWL